MTTAARQSHAAPVALEMRGVRKHFHNVAALRDVDIEVTTGTVHALLGENGAGKSTLMRIAYGSVERDAGDAHLFGHRVERAHSVRDAARLGVGMVHQHPFLVGSLTAAENLALGGRGLFRPGASAMTLDRVSRESGLHVPPGALVRDLSVVEQQRLEILKALARGARLLILDEPTAVLPPSEVRDLLRWIRAYVDGGGTVVLITHKLREALAVADEVTVLRRGRVAHHGGTEGTSEETLSLAIFPEAIEAPAPPTVSAPGNVVVRAQGIVVKDTRGIVRVREATFEFRQNEIVGLAAVEGSGHRDLLRVLSAQQRIDGGELELPADIALIPADRMREALIPAFDLAENVALRQVGRRRGVMPWAAIRGRTADVVRAFDISAASIFAPARTLSGGNQQRLVIARELEQDVPLLVADNPTRGLDIRATVFVHEQLRRAAARGAAVVVHSSDLDEVLAVATRVLVVFDGVVSEVSGGREAVGRAMLGAA